MLPKAFCTRMKQLLGDEYAEFEAALTGGDAVRGLRINRIKASDTAMPSELPLTPLSFCDEGFILNSEDPLKCEICFITYVSN